MRHHACDHETTETMQRKHLVSDALDAMELAIEEYYNGDRAWAEEWLLKAMAANQDKGA
jgi:alcohol dehydrogenase class IV